MCREDNLIQRFGAMQFEKYGMTQNELIKQYMRQVGRLLIELQSKDPEIKDLSSCLNPPHFDLIVQATKSICMNYSRLPRDHSLKFHH